MKGLFLDAVDDLADVFRRVVHPDDPPVTVNEQLEVPPETLPGLLAGYDFVLDDHSQMPTDVMRHCPAPSTSSSSAPERAATCTPRNSPSIGITVHIIKGYGDTAVADIDRADVGRGARSGGDGPRHARGPAGRGPRVMQLTGKTLGLLGFGGIAAEVARIASGVGHAGDRLEPLAEIGAGREFVDLDRCWPRATCCRCTCC